MGRLTRQATKVLLLSLVAQRVLAATHVTVSEVRPLVFQCQDRGSAARRMLGTLRMPFVANLKSQPCAERCESVNRSDNIIIPVTRCYRVAYFVIPAGAFALVRTVTNQTTAPYFKTHNRRPRGYYQQRAPRCMPAYCSRFVYFVASPRRAKRK